MRRAPLIIFSDVIFLVSLAGPVLSAYAQNEEIQEPFKVVTKDIEPFVFVDGAKVSGFTIGLWQALTRAVGIDYEFVFVTTVQEQLAAAESGQVDVVVAAITITEEREKMLDFPYHYYESALGIMIHSDARTSIRDIFLLALSPSLLRLFILLGLSMLIAAHVIWLIEHGRNPDFRRAYFRGVWEGSWWAAAAVTTVGYGHKTPIGKFGRLFALFWMFAGLFIIAKFAVNVASQLTLQSIRGKITGPADLRGKQVAAVSGSTGDAWLSSEAITFRTGESVGDAYPLLDNGITQVTVYDYPGLQHYALQDERGRFSMAGPAFNEEDYAIAVPVDSPLREDIDRALLKLQEEGTCDQIYVRWYGES